MVSAAVAEYLQEYKEVNMNPAKPEPKGLRTTRDRVFKWLWYLDSRSVVFCRDVASAHLIILLLGSASVGHGAVCRGARSRGRRMPPPP